MALFMYGSFEDYFQAGIYTPEQYVKTQRYWHEDSPIWDTLEGYSDAWISYVISTLKTNDKPSYIDVDQTAEQLFFDLMQYVSHMFSFGELDPSNDEAAIYDAFGPDLQIPDIWYTDPVFMRKFWLTA